MDAKSTLCTEVFLMSQGNIVQLFELQTEQKVFCFCFFSILSACHQFLLEKQFTNYSYVDLGIFSFFFLFFFWKWAK